jgi:hypothetical protein
VPKVTSGNQYTNKPFQEKGPFLGMKPATPTS